ncbi:MAG: undecaprenyl phosphate translocase family protein, partial [Chlamydiales bacterium]
IVYGLNLSGFWVAHTAHSRLSGWLIFCGMVAVCALLLPGISGSYLLTLLGVYPMVIGALADWVSHLKQGIFDFDSFEILLNLGLGILIGAALFARLLSWLLKAYPNLSLAILSGFMIGALPSVWPFWSYTSILLPMKLEKGPQLLALDPIWPSWSSSQAYLALLWMAAGCLLVIGLELLARYKNSQPDAKE